MMGEERLKSVMFLVMIVLEIVLILDIRSRRKAERTHSEKCEKLTAVVKEITQKNVTSKYVTYGITVRADNGFIYDVYSNSRSCSVLTEGSTVEILVPEGAEGRTEEDEYFRTVCLGGREALEKLSHEEKLRLNEYLDRQMNRIQNKTPGDLEEAVKNRLPTLVSDGSGTKRELLPMCILAAAIGLLILIIGVLVILDRR